MNIAFAVVGVIIVGCCCPLTLQFVWKARDGSRMTSRLCSSGSSTRHLNSRLLYEVCGGCVDGVLTIESRLGTKQVHEWQNTGGEDGDEPESPLPAYAESNPARLSCVSIRKSCSFD